MTTRSSDRTPLACRLVTCLVAVFATAAVFARSPAAAEEVERTTGVVPESIASRYGGPDAENRSYDSLVIHYDGLADPITQSPLYVDLDQLRITKFSAKEGAPVFPTALQQSADGTLWVASQNGLARFDGMTFDRSPGNGLPSPVVMSLFSGRGDELWIGYTFGGISRLDGGGVHTYAQEELPKGSVLRFSYDEAGNLFAMTTTGVARLLGDHWRQVTDADGYSGKNPRWIGTYAGRLWIVDEEGAFRYRVADNRFERVGQDIPESPDAPVPYRIMSRRSFEYNGQERLIDRSGAVWSRSSEGSQRYRWIVEGATWRRTSTERLVTPDNKQNRNGLFVDREGNVWLTGGWGLMQATATKFTPLRVGSASAKDTTDDPVVMGMGRKGRLWFGGTHPGVRLPGEPLTEIPELGSYVGCITETADGTVWAVSDTGVRAKKEGNVRFFPSDPAKEFGRNCQSIVPDSMQGTWISIAKAGVFTLEDGRWVEASTRNGLPAGPAIRLVEDPQRRLWLTYPRNRIAMIDGGHTTLWTDTQGLDIGNVLTLYADGDVVWAGGDTGVSHLAKGRFLPLRGQGGERFRGCAGILQTRTGELWINASDGVFRVSADEIRRAQADPRYQVAFERFDERDGIGSPPPPLRPGPALQQAEDGTLWFTGENSLASIHPGHVRRNPIAPIVSIRRLVAENEARRGDGPIVFPPRTRSLSIEYTSAMLTSPDRVRFRYRLEGADGDWHDVGNRRTAYFTNLEPGKYRFFVDAFNEDGVPSRQSAVVTFGILPAWYQTWWFKTSMVLGIAVIGFFLIRLQLRRSTDRVRLLLNERNAERERIARDLHDTLLQDFQGLSLHLQAWSVSPQASESLRRQIAGAADSTVTALKVGRAKIQLLREGPVPDEGIERAIRLCAEQVIGEAPVAFDLHVEGVRRPLVHAAQEEAVAIVRECIRNSLVHGGASRIDVTVRFTRSALEISVGDNGHGSSVAPPDEKTSTGHWGIIGMKERAQLIGARFALTFTASGAVARLRIPSVRAFARRER